MLHRSPQIRCTPVKITLRSLAEGKHLNHRVRRLHIHPNDSADSVPAFEDPLTIDRN
jgi:hypothetical protein